MFAWCTSFPCFYFCWVKQLSCNEIDKFRVIKNGATRRSRARYLTFQFISERFAFAAVLRQILQTFCGLKIGQGYIPGIMPEHSMVHASSPQVRHISPDNHARVTVGKLRRFIKVTQRLITARRVGVVIGMPLQLEQKDIGDNSITVPRVPR